MIKRLEEIDAYKPLRGHLHVGFEICRKTEFITKIYDYLTSEGFDTTLSRALVFVKSRRKAEDYAAQFNEYGDTENVAIIADAYHAGMDAEVRDVAKTNYQEGKTSILFATKAFGMGMDIPNIHFLFHIQPSSSFEDFLQEIGRAGRNKKAYEDAGFDEQKRIKTICFYEKEDFATIKDLMKKSQIGWTDIENIFKIVNAYYGQFRQLEPNKENPLPLPLDLLSTHPDYVEHEQRSVIYKLALYWLERLGRYQLEYFVPSFFEFSNHILDNSDFDKSAIKNASHLALYELIEEERNEKFKGMPTSLISVEDIYQLLERKNLNEVMKLIIGAQSADYVRLLHKIRIDFTKLRIAEVKGKIWHLDFKLPLIEAIFAFATAIVETVPKFERKQFNNQELNDIGLEVVADFFTKEAIDWIEESKKVKYLKKAIKDFVEKRLKHSFWLINQVPKMNCESIIDTENGELVYFVSNNDKANEWRTWLRELKKNVYKFLYYFTEYFNRHGKIVEVVEAIIESGIQPKTLGYFDSILILLKKMGYLKIAGGLIPMSIELYLKSIEPIDISDFESADGQVHEEFKETIRLKKLRLAVLEIFANLGSEERQNEFMRAYFQCADSSEIVNLLEESIRGTDSNIIREFREEALTDAEKRLNERQRGVYDAPIDEHLSVIAGPGSGKTHTLILRIARLIQNENINPENILVLAYNRAVVVELKERLLNLFSKLGYRRLTKSLKVFTFHGLIKYALQDDLSEDFSKWESEFIEKSKDNPGFIRARLGVVNYIFVDEFQDITNKRLDILEILSGFQDARLTVIGDPNQSIYGFDRTSDGAPRSPRPYYAAFKERFNPNYLFLTKNYRSYPLIIEKAEEVLELQAEEIAVEGLEWVKEVPENAGNYVETFEVGSPNVIRWREKLKELVVSQQFQQIALMVRTNVEIFRTYEIVRKLDLGKIDIRIQGESGSFVKSREVAHFLFKMEGHLQKEINDAYFVKFVTVKNHLIEQKKNWNRFFLDVLHILIVEFEKGKNEDATYADLLSFVADFTKKDDGQLYQLYELKREEMGFPERREIVLTTMHRVKGLEFPAVLVLPSFADLPYAEKPPFEPEELDAIYDEEIRLLYVAYSRAERYLGIFNWQREAALFDRIPFQLEGVNLGFSVKTGIDKFIIFTLAKKKNQEYLSDVAQVGDSVNLKLSGNGNWVVYIEKTQMGVLSSKNLKKNKELEHVPLVTLQGFVVTSFLHYTLAESENYDEEHGTNYADNWDTFCKNQGYIIIPDFSGYGK